MNRLFIKCGLYFWFCILLISCDPKDKENCDLSDSNGKKYLGMVHLCNAVPSQQLDFEASALLSVTDSLLIFNIISDEISPGFNYNVEVLYDCSREEGGLVYFLSNPEDSSNVGYITNNVKGLFLNLIVDQCETNSFFDGLIE